MVCLGTERMFPASLVRNTSRSVRLNRQGMVAEKVESVSFRVSRGYLPFTKRVVSSAMGEFWKDTKNWEAFKLSQRTILGRMLNSEIVGN